MLFLFSSPNPLQQERAICLVCGVFGLLGLYLYAHKSVLLVRFYAHVSVVRCRVSYYNVCSDLYL